MIWAYIFSLLGMVVVVLVNNVISEKCTMHQFHKSNDAASLETSWVHLIDASLYPGTS